jgi:pimeloyl-ACP methyl ester carboxylesterase
MDLPDGCPIAGKLDEGRMGIVGFSQGGAGALAALTQYENGCLYRTVFTGSAAYPFLAENMGWHYDASQVSVPWLMVAGTGASDDAGVEDPTKEFGGVAPLSSLIEDYDTVDPSLPRVRARAVGAEHEDMLVRSDGYMTAWLLWQLCDDGDAAQAFVGADAEIARNPGWQDVEKSV